MTAAGEVAEPLGGGLQKLKIAWTGRDSATESPVVALFNPHEISRSRSVDWYQKTVASQGGGWTWLDTQQQFLAVGAETLAIELFFDTYEQRDASSGWAAAVLALVPPDPFGRGDATPVTALTRHVARLAEVDPNLHHPPVCTLSWGKFGVLFTGVLTQLDQRFTLFTANGTPVRATLSCSFLEYQTSAHARAREMNSADVVKTHVVRRGDTLHSIAAAEYRDATRWRLIASANGVVNPRTVAPGTVLTLPRLG